MVTTHLSRRNIICIDVESNGLYGQPFCVGAVEMDWGGRVLRQFLARCPIDEVEEDWVLENVIPTLKGVNESHENAEEMAGGFLNWFSSAIDHYQDSSPIILVDVGFPVDNFFLYAAFQNISRSSESWVEKYSPYPLMDLSSVLAGAGHDPDIDRVEFSRELRGWSIADEIFRHHPVFDAEASALCLIRIIREMEDRAQVR